MLALVPQLIGSALRHGGTFLGGFLAARGLSTGDETELALGALATFVGWAVSIYRQWTRTRAA